LAAGAQRAALLPVAVASHTPRLAAAVPSLRAAIMEQRPRQPRTEAILLTALDGSPVFDVAAGADALARQVATSLRWNACLDAAVERGGNTFLELGPGRALVDMARTAYPVIPARSLDDFRSRDGVLAWLARNQP
ncbi:MAG: malonate decarboxylase subunit epsilon, partial [Gammaproteobacteria bacterium]